MKINKELKIGIITLITVGVFYWLFSFLEGRNLFTRGDIFYAKYSNVDGLLPSKPVNINGLKVGSVEDIKIVEKKDSMYFVVKMVLERKIDFSTNTVAEIYEPGIMAGKMIKLNLSYDGSKAKDGDTLKTNNSPSLMAMISSKLSPTQNKLDSVLVTLNSTLYRYGNLADEETNKSLKNVLASLDTAIKSLNQTAHNFAKTSESSTRLVNNLNSKVGKISENADNTLAAASSTLEKFGEVATRLNTEDLSKTLANLEATTTELKNYIKTVEGADGTLNKMIKDKELYNNLAKTSENLNILVEDLRNEPSKYVQFSVFGKKSKPKKSNKKED